ncbi:MAG: hypothetical protein JSS99_06905 [Actinobacteria bacterium]|nr:hypothetical protein [Actinomycetota bacterium]
MYTSSLKTHRETRPALKRFLASDGLLQHGESTRFSAVLSGIRREDRTNELVSLEAVGDLEYVGKQPGPLISAAIAALTRAPVA